MGKSGSHIANLMRLLQLEELKRLLAEGELSVGHAKFYLGLMTGPPTSHWSLSCSGRLTVRQIEDAITNGFGVSSNKFRKVLLLFYMKVWQTPPHLQPVKVKIKASSKGKVHNFEVQR